MRASKVFLSYSRLDGLAVVSRLDSAVDWDSAFRRVCEILRGAPPRNVPHPRAIPCADPFRPYLNELLRYVVDQLRYREPSGVLELSTRQEEGKVDLPLPVFLPLTTTQEYPVSPVEQCDSSLRGAFDACNGRLLLLGDAGAGKTVSLLHFARTVVAERLADSVNPLPILADIGRWDPDSLQPLEQWLSGCSPRHSAQVLDAIRKGEALLLLDGLDELGSRRPLDPTVLTVRVF